MSPLLATLDVETTPRLRAVIGRLSRRLRPTAAAVAAGLTPTKISVLLHVARAGQIRLSELSEAEGINPTMCCYWKKKLLGSAKRVFDEKNGRPSAQEEKKEAELQRMKDVIAEITAENLELKKGLSG